MEATRVYDSAHDSAGKSRKTASFNTVSFPDLDCLPTFSSESGSDFTKTQLSNMFDPAALPYSSSLDQSLQTKSSSETEEKDKTSSDKGRGNNSFRMKLKSPIKVLSRRKKNFSDSKQDMAIFEEKAPMDLLDDNMVNSDNENNGFCYSRKERSAMQMASKSNYSSKRSPPMPFSSLNNISNNSPSCRGFHQPTLSNSNTRGGNLDKVKQLFSGQREKDSQVDLSIGLRLALPDKLDIMTGTTPIKEDSTKDTPSKKLIIVREKNGLQKNLFSPFKRKVQAKPLKVKSSSQTTRSSITTISNDTKKEILFRTGEHEPSVHQITIPEATELLIHARVCALMEGYDKLLETRAKAGKRWFSFGHLVGVSRKDLENMYLCAIGKKPEIPMFIGEDIETFPPPLPKITNVGFIAPHIGNPFDANIPSDGRSQKSVPSLDSGDSYTKTAKSKYPRKRSSAPSPMKPHPSTIKSLLECADDLIVEGYFNETIGDENTLIEDIESTSVQVAVFSSQRTRQFIVCYRGTIGQHSKPIKRNMHYRIDCNGLNEVFGNSYLPELEEKVFALIERLSTENPFCDVVFTGHSFGGGLALVAALRCAETYQVMTVSCFGFGVPKIGQKDFRLKCHMLPNLKIIRLEHCSDTYVDLPAAPWEHVGHTITINYSTNKKRTIVNPRGKEGETISATAIAYKFGKKELHGHINPMDRVRNTIDSRAKKMQGKSDHEMRNYLHALENFTHMGTSQWVNGFANELGTGIVTAENEVRLVV